MSVPCTCLDVRARNAWPLECVHVHVCVDTCCTFQRRIQLQTTTTHKKAANDNQPSKTAVRHALDQACNMHVVLAEPVTRGPSHEMQPIVPSRQSFSTWLALDQASSPQACCLRTCCTQPYNKATPKQSLQHIATCANALQRACADLFIVFRIRP